MSRRRRQVVRTPLAVATDGTLLLNVATDPKLDATKALELALRHDAPVFIGIAVTQEEAALVMSHLDDKAAEVLAVILGERQRRRRETARRTKRTPS